MGLIPVASGDIATIVTALEMTGRPKLRALPESHLRLVRWKVIAPEKYRMLFRRVGSPWLWFSRLVMDDEKLSAILDDEAVQMWAVVDLVGVEVGMLELDFRIAGQCELAFFGLVPELAGQGHGRWLMAHALSAAWRAEVSSSMGRKASKKLPVALGSITINLPGGLRTRRISASAKSMPDCAT